MTRHPGLFFATGVEEVTADDRHVQPVLWEIDELVEIAGTGQSAARPVLGASIHSSRMT